MWNIKEIKRKGKKTLKNNLWTLLFLGLFMSFAIGRYMLNNDGFSNLKTLYEHIVNQNESEENNQDHIANEIVNKIISQIFTGNVTGIINDYNEKHNVTKGAIYTTFNILTKGQQQLQNTINSIMNYENKEAVRSIILIIASMLGFLIRVFLVYPIRISESRIYLESINYKKTRIKRITYAFKNGRYLNSVKTLLLIEIKKFLWNLTIVGGIIKNYSYKMVTYIIAENTSISAEDAIKMSEEMMNGNKLQAFKLDVSFLGWSILQYITFGILGVYVSPYYTSTYTVLYETLREDYIKNKKYKYELLNDYKLFEINDLEKYPDIYEAERKRIKIDYNKKYEISSIILFFFIFSFIGWIWEVSLYLFRDGMLVNRGTLHGPWLPIYGWGCTIIILLTRFKKFREILKNPVLTFIIIVIVCSIIEYMTSWYIELVSGLRYWDYTGVFLNLNGRICFECSAFFGLGGALCVYIVAPFLERKIQKIMKRTKIIICIILLSLITIDNCYSIKYPNMGEEISIVVEENK